jgi:hypothetical protein
MTIDFLAIVQRNNQELAVGYDAKRDEEANDERSIDKLEIMRSVFEKLAIPYHLVFHSNIPKQKARNIDWIRHGLIKPDEVEPHPNYFSDMAARMKSELAHGSKTTALSQFCEAFDDRHGARPGTGLRVARILMNDRTMLPNLESQDLQAEQIGHFQLDDGNGLLRAIGGR